MLVKREWIAGIIILLTSWLTYQGYESLYFFKIPLYSKHLINFTLLMAVATAGYFVWRNHPQKWTLYIWKLVYLAIIILMIIVGLFDLFFHFDISNFREMIHNLRMFFTSPVPYGVMLFLVNRLNEKEKKLKKNLPQ